MFTFILKKKKNLIILPNNKNTDAVKIWTFIVGFQ